MDLAGVQEDRLQVGEFEGRACDDVDRAGAQQARVPRYSSSACGGLGELNLTVEVLYWGKETTRRYFPRLPQTVQDDVTPVLEILRTRKVQDRRSLRDLLDDPEDQDDASYRFSSKEFAKKGLDTESNGQFAWEKGGKSDWRHGTGASLRRCTPSCGTTGCGHRRMPKEERGSSRMCRACMSSRTTGRKTRGGYARGVHLGWSRAWWSTCWEVFVDRTMRIMKKGTEQWVQPECSVRLAALWVRCRAHENMENGAEIQERWVPEREAHPEKFWTENQQREEREGQRRGVDEAQNLAGSSSDVSSEWLPWVDLKRNQSSAEEQPTMEESDLLEKGESYREKEFLGIVGEVFEYDWDHVEREGAEHNKALEEGKNIPDEGVSEKLEWGPNESRPSSREEVNWKKATASVFGQVQLVEGPEGSTENSMLMNDRNPPEELKTGEMSEDMKKVMGELQDSGKTIVLNTSEEAEKSVGLAKWSS